jgi:hypothetical protein
MSDLSNEVEVMDMDARYAGDSKLFVVFSMKAEKNGFQSEQQGRPIFDDVPHIRIHIPGDKNSVTERPVTEQDKIRFASRWEKFLKGLQTADQGTPLEAWPVLSTGQVQEFKAMGVFNVEGLADMNDAFVQKFMGGNELRRKAQTFLKVSKDTAEAQRLATANHELTQRLATLEAQNRDIMAKFAALQEAHSKAPPAPPLKGQADGNVEATVRRGAQ